MANQQQPRYVWDFTLKRESATHEQLKQCITGLAKRGGFQAEIGDETEYKHWNGRFSLREKHRKTALIKAWPFKDVHFSITNNACCSGERFWEYITKDHTYDPEGGRWTSRQVEMPWHLKCLTENLKPWQQTIWEMSRKQDKDHIDVLIDPDGYNGKSHFALWCQVTDSDVFDMPPVQTMKDMMQIAYCVDTKKTYFIDLPRALEKGKQWDFWMGVECLKRGKIYDVRHTYKEKIIGAPNIWIFTNEQPEIHYITRRRWRFWGITNDELIRQKLPKIKARIKKKSERIAEIYREMERSEN